MKVRDERGSAALEVAIGAPVMLLLVVLVVAGGRVALARQTVTAAADSAARAASISRTAPAATSLARNTVRSILSAQQVDCRTLDVSVDSRAFASAPGTPGNVQATVTCHLDLTSLGLPGLGSLTITDTGTSPLDTFRGRR